MDTRYDHQGKYFTDFVNKKQISAVIQTIRQRIEGTVYVLPNHRLLDELSSAAGFIAVTAARIIEGETQQTADFVAVNVDQIVWMIQTAETEPNDGNR